MSGLLRFFGTAFAVLGVAAGGYYGVLGVRADFGGDVLLIYAVATLFSTAAFAALFYGVAEVLERLPERASGNATYRRDPNPPGWNDPR